MDRSQKLYEWCQNIRMDSIPVHGSEVNDFTAVELSKTIRELFKTIGMPKISVRKERITRYDTVSINIPKDEINGEQIHECRIVVRAILEKSFPARHGLNWKIS